MKKYIGAIFLAGLLFTGAFQAQAVTFDDLLKEITSLRDQVSGLKTQVSAAVIKSGTSYEVAKMAPAASLAAAMTTTTPTQVTPTVTVQQTPTVVIAATNTAPSFSRSLAFGETSQEVKTFQIWLISKGYLTGEATGYYGPGTVNAVKKLQAEKGIVGDGTSFGPQTQAALSGTFQAQAPSNNGGVSSSYPAGCTSFSGTSTITGLPCAPQQTQLGLVCRFNNPTPQIQITSPNGGETFALGQVVKVTWQTCGAPANAMVRLHIGNTPGQYYSLTTATSIPGYPMFTANDGEEFVTLNSVQNGNGPQIVPGTGLKVYAVLTVQNSLGEPPILAEDYSDNTFTVSNTTVPTCTGRVIQDFGGLYTSYYHMDASGLDGTLTGVTPYAGGTMLLAQIWLDNAYTSYPTCDLKVTNVAVNISGTNRNTVDSFTFQNVKLYKYAPNGTKILVATAPNIVLTGGTYNITVNFTVPNEILGSLSSNTANPHYRQFIVEGDAVLPTAPMNLAFRTKFTPTVVFINSTSPIVYYPRQTVTGPQMTFDNN